MSEPIINPLLTRVNKMPGETIRLPSLGKFYTNGELTEDSINGEIVLLPMTMTDEIIMKSADMLFQGTAIERVFKRCSPNILKPLDLLTGDVDYILTHLRRISFGPFVDVKFKCEHEECGHENEVRIPLEHFTSESKEIDIDHFDDLYVVHTETDPKTVYLKPITFREFILTQQINIESLNEIENFENFILDSFVNLIAAVEDLKNDSDQNREFIKEWISVLPRSDTEIITNAVKNIQDWGPSFRYKTKCSKCKKVHELSTELNPTAFFTQPSSPKTKNA